MANRWFGPLMLLVALTIPSAVHAQGAQSGRILGRVIDGATGRPLPGAQLVVQGTRAGTLAGVGGRYVIVGAPRGTQALVVSFLGYGSKTVTGVQVPPNGAVSLEVSLDPAAIALEGVTVSAERERGTVSRALNEQRRATGVVSAVTAEQISRSPDGDAASAVQRVSGVTVQDGKYVFVRGLGERYTTTSLNGARIPSPEPERKVVPLDLFPSGLLQSVTTAKTFTPNLSGDFSGAQVDIRTREFPGKRQIAFSLSTGYNSVATGRNIVTAPAEGSEWLGFAGPARALPGEAEAAGNFQDRSIDQQEMNRIASSFRNVWSTERQTGLPNGSFGLSVGGSSPVAGRDVGYLASGTYSQTQEARVDEVRATTLAATDGSAAEASRFEGSTGRVSVLWGGLLNLSASLGSATRISFDNTYNRSADNEARSERGSSENLGGFPLDIDRLRFVEREVHSNQLKGEHQLGQRHRADWSLASSGVSRIEPDRSEIVYITETDPATGQRRTPVWFGGSNEAAVRTFGSLNENSWEGSGNYHLTLGRVATGPRIQVGGLYRTTERDAENRSYSISAPGTLGREARQAPPEQIFDGRFTSPGSSILNITPLGAGGSYTAQDRLWAGFGMVEYTALERLRLVAGARVERSEVTVDAVPTTGSPVTTDPQYTDVLPSLALNLEWSSNVNLRLSASRTLARPEYRELSPILYREVIGGENVFGNPDLKRTLIDNYDARYEWYPAPGEVLSLGVFAKRFTNPIERAYVAASGTALVTFVNATSAENYGVELEARKNLRFLSPALAPLALFTNATLMHSEIRIGSEFTSKTTDERPMVGQAPYVLNAGLTYSSLADQGTSATLLYNVVGKRITSAAEAPLPDVYEMPRHALDLSLRFAVRPGLSAKVDAKNLLDAAHEVRQGGVVREYYRAGRVLSLGLTWQP